MKWNLNLGVHLCTLSFVLLQSCSQVSTVSNTSGQYAEGEIQLEVKKYTLDNGLRLIVYENQKLPIFSYYTFFDVGGRHESGGTTGATHFLEHMMFKGAKKYGPGIFDSMIEGNGGNTNAYTNFDNTVYYQSIPIKSENVNMVETIIDMEADRMQHLALVPEAFEKERKVVLEERKMRYENSPQGQLYLTLMQEMFTGTPYGGSVIGSKEDLLNLKRDQVMDYFKKFYTPDNAIIVVAGAVDAEEVYSLVKDKFGDIKPSTAEIKEYRKSRDDTSLYRHQAKYGRHIKLHSPQSPNPIFMMAYPGNPIGTREGFVRDILASILGQGESSYLNKKFVVGKRPLFTSVSSHNYTLKYNGIFWISGELLAGKSLRSSRQKLIKEMSRVCEKAIDERSLQKTKNQYLIGYIQEIETNKGVAHFLGMRENYFGDYSYYNKELEIYNSISVDEVKKSCHELLDGGKHLFVSVWNKNPKKGR